jgi:hypothetical protein
MRTFVVSGLILGIWAAPALAEQAASELWRGTQPVTLSEAQMDRVTAGAVGIDITAEAIAGGASGGLTDTDTRTHARGNRQVSVAVGTGHARAVGDWRDVDLSVSLFTDSEVLASNTKIIEIDNPAQSIGHATGVIVVENGTR